MMRPRGHFGDFGQGRRLIALAGTALALASAAVGAVVGVPTFDDWKGQYGPLPPSLRDDPVALFLGFDDETWEALDRLVADQDRYALVVRGRNRLQVLNYAAYRLLPALRVIDSHDADAVIYYGGAAPESCLTVGERVCVVRRPRA